MGVAGGANYLRTCSRARRNQTAADRIEIQTSSPTLTDSIRACCRASHSNNADILIDVAGSFGHLFHSLPKQHGIFGSGAFFARTIDRNAETTEEDTRKRINTLFTEQVNEAVLQLAQQLPQSRIFLFVDNKDFVGKAKLQTYCERQQRKVKAQQFYRAAYAEINQLHLAAEAYKARRTAGAPIAEDDFKTVYRRHLPKNRQRRQENRRKKIRPLLRKLFENAWAVFRPQLDTALLTQQTGAVVLTEHLSTGNQSWRTANPRIAGAGPRIRLVNCISEADLSIYSYCQASTQVQHRFRVVISNDSDYAYVLNAQQLQYTVSYYRWFHQSRRQLSSKPYTSTSLLELSRQTSYWPWQDDEARWLTLLVAGHDYVVGGLLGLGLAKLASTRVTCTEDLDTMYDLLIEQERPLYRRAAYQLQRSSDTFEAALQVFRTFTHVQATEEDIAQATAALEENKTNKQKKKKGSPHVNIELRFRPSADGHTSEPRPTHAQSIPYARRPCKTGNLHLDRKRHQAWVYNFETPETDRRDLLGPDEEPALRAEVEFDDNKTARPERLKLMAAGKGFKPKERRAQTATQIAQEEANALAALAAEDIAAKEDAKNEASAGGRQNLQIVGTIYPIRCHRRLLASSLQSFSQDGVFQKDKAFHDLLRFHCFCVRLVIRNLNALFKLYMARLTTVPANAFLATFRFAFDTSSNLQGIYRGFIHLLQLEQNVRYAQYTDHRPLAEVIEAYADRWAAIQKPNAGQEAQLQVKHDLIMRLRNIPADLLHAADAIKSDVQTDIVMLEVIRDTHARDICRIFPGRTDVLIEIALKKVRTAWLRQARRAPYIITLDGVFYQLLVNDDAFNPTELALRDLRKSTVERLRGCILESVHGDNVDTIENLDDILEPLSPAAQVSIRAKLVQILILRNRFVPAVPDAASPPTLDSILCGRCTKLQCPAKFAVPLFGAIGHDFTIDYQPSMIPFDSEALWWLVKYAANHMQNLVSWFQKDWLDFSLLYPSTDNGACLNLSNKSTPTLLESMNCFNHTSYKDLHASPGVNPCLELDPAWLERLAKWTAAVEKVWAIRDSDNIRSSRLQIFDAIFMHTLPSGEIWAGTLETDGEEVIFRSIAVTQGYIDDKLVAKIQPKLPRPLEECRADRVLAEILKVPNTFSDIRDFEKTTVVGVGYRHSPKNSHPQKQPQEGDKNLYKIFTTLQWLSGRQTKQDRNAAPEPGSQWHGRRPFVKLAKEPKEVSTHRGLPKDLPILDARSADTFRKDLHAAMFGADTPYDATLAWLPQVRMVGDDLGDVAPNAIAINSPALPQADDAMECDQPVNDLSINSSLTMVMKASGLQEMIRRATTYKQSLRNQHYIRLDHLRQHPRYHTPFSHEWRMHSFHEELVQSSTAWLTHSHLRKNERRAYEDRFYQQFKDLAFPTPESLSRPILFAVGDSCGFNARTRSAPRHTAAFANPLFRALRKKCMDNKLPVIFVIVDEAYSSQVCPNPDCFNEEHPIWRAGVEFDKRGERCLSKKGRDVPDEMVRVARSRLFKAYYKGTLDQCLRVLQCETCKTVYHRDAAAGMNIAFIGWHILRFGRHPWRYVEV